MSRFDVSSFIQALLLNAAQMRNNRPNNVGVSGADSGNSLQTNPWFNNFMAGFGRANSDMTQMSRTGSNFTLDVAPMGPVSTNQSLIGAGAANGNTDVTLGTGLFGAPLRGRKVTQQVAVDSGDNLAANTGLRRSTVLQGNASSTPNQATTNSNVSVQAGNGLAETGQALINGKDNVVVFDGNQAQRSIQLSKNADDTVGIVTGGIGSMAQTVEGDPASTAKKKNNATLLLDQTLDSQTVQVARNGAGDVMLADSNGMGSLAALQASNNSKGQVVGVDGRIGDTVFTAQSTKDSSGNQAAVIGNSIATKGLGAAQNNTGSGNSVIQLTGNLAPDVLGAQINNVSATDKTLNSLAMAAVGNLATNPDGTPGNLLLVQDNKTGAKDVLIVAKDNVATTSIAQNTTGSTEKLGTVVDGNLGATTVKQLIVGQDGKPILVNSENIVQNTLLGNTVQGSARQEAKGTTTINNTGTLDGVSVFNAAKNTDGTTTITVDKANNLSGTPSFATSTVDGNDLSAIGDVAIASQRKGDKGATTVNLTNNFGNQTLNANDLNSGNQTVIVKNATGGIVTLADRSASDGGSTATRNTTVDGVLLGQVTASTSSTNQGDVNQTVNNVVKLDGTPFVTAQAGNLGASGDVALVADRALGKGNVTQSGTMIAGDVGAAGRQTQADGGVNQTFNKVDGSVTTFGSVDKSSGGVKTTVADVSGQVNITGQATNSGGGVTVDAQRAQDITIGTMATNGGATNVKASDANTITVQAAGVNGPVNTTVERTNVATVISGTAGNTIGNNSSTINNVGTANAGFVAVDTGTAANDSSATLKISNADTANVIALAATDKNQVDVKAGTVNGTIVLGGSGADTVKIDGTGGGKDLINLDTQGKTGTTNTQVVLSDGSVVNFRGGKDFATLVDVKADAAGGKVQANLEEGGLYTIKMNNGTSITGVTKEQMDKLAVPVASTPATSTPTQGIAVGEPNPATPATTYKTPTGTVTTNTTSTVSAPAGSTVSNTSTNTVNGTPVGNGTTATTWAEPAKTTQTPATTPTTTSGATTWSDPAKTPTGTVSTSTTGTGTSTTTVNGKEVSSSPTTTSGATTWSDPAKTTPASTPATSSGSEPAKTPTGTVSTSTTGTGTSTTTVNGKEVSSSPTTTSGATTVSEPAKTSSTSTPPTDTKASTATGTTETKTTATTTTTNPDAKVETKKEEVVNGVKK